jgi:hypothetical protein
MSGMGTTAPVNFEVELPAGGKLHLSTIDEVEVFEDTREAYLRDFQIKHHSDKLAIGSLLLMHLEVFRNQHRLNGMEAEVDVKGVPTGRYVKAPIKPTEKTAILSVLLKMQAEIRDAEKALGVDKKTRDSGGQYDTKAYVDSIREAAGQWGVHLSRRYLAYEAFVRGLRVRIRMLDTLDAEDLQHENISVETIMASVRTSLAKLEEADRKFAHEKGRLIVGQIR